MKKLLCVNSQKIVYKTKYVEITSHGTGLVEGEVYITRGKPYYDENNRLCYFIDGLGEKLACRFTELLSDTEEERIAEKAIKKLKEEFELN
jgi:hypothetical protein